MNKVRGDLPSALPVLHVMGVPIFNYLFAVNQKGQLVLRRRGHRLERSKPEYEEET